VAEAEYLKDTVDMLCSFASFVWRSLEWTARKKRFGGHVDKTTGRRL
jgi:hypothetical protein